MRDQRLSVIIFGFLFILGCASAFLKPTSEGSYVLFDGKASGRDPAEPKKEQTDAVQIFYQTEPKRAFSEVGIVEAVAKGQKVSLNDVLPQLKRQAALMKADAIYKIQIQRYDHVVPALHATGVALNFSDVRKNGSPGISTPH